MSQKKKELDSIHTELTKELLRLIRSGEAKSSDLNVARQFLKDNDITTIPVDNNEITDLISELPFSEDNEEDQVH